MTQRAQLPEGSPKPEEVTIPIDLFDWQNEHEAVEYALGGAIALLLIPQQTNLQGKKHEAMAVSIYCRDKETLSTFLDWIGGKKSGIRKNGRAYSAIVGGRFMRRAFAYLGRGEPKPD